MSKHDSTEGRELVQTLVAIRQGLGLTQHAVGQAMGCAQSQVSQFEHSADPQLSTVLRYAKSIGAEFEYLFRVQIPEEEEEEK